MVWSPTVGASSLASAACVETVFVKEGLEWRRDGVRVRGWSGRRDQVGGWGRCRVGGDEEAKFRQQEVGRGDVEQSEAREAESRQQEVGRGDVE